MDRLSELDDEMVDTEADDVSLAPGANADPSGEIHANISADILEMYDVYSYRHAASILKTAYPTELKEIEDMLRAFRIKPEDIAKPGGNESPIPKTISKSLRPLGWCETRISGDLIVKLIEQSEKIDPVSGRSEKFTLAEKPPVEIKNYIDGHKIDYVKGKVAFDLEWNSKDQTFDRDLYAFRMFHECGIVSVAVILTRSAKMNPIFEVIPRLNKDGRVEVDKEGKPVPIKSKYGASTTWMGKLLYRLNAGRHGGCPVLVLGIRPGIILELDKFLEGLNERQK